MLVRRQGGTYTDKNVKYTRLDEETQYPNRLSRGLDTEPASYQQLAIFPLCNARVVNQSKPALATTIIRKKTGNGSKGGRRVR